MRFAQIVPPVNAGCAVCAATHALGSAVRVALASTTSNPSRIHAVFSNEERHIPPAEKVLEFENWMREAQ